MVSVICRIPVQQLHSPVQVAPILTRAIVASHGLCSGWDAARSGRTMLQLQLTSRRCVRQHLTGSQTDMHWSCARPPPSHGPSSERWTNALACRQWCHHVDFGAGRRQRGMERSAATAAPSHLWTKCGTPRRRSANRGHTTPTKTGPDTCFHSLGVFIFPICFHFPLFVFMKTVPGLNSWISCDQILLLSIRELVTHNLPRPERGVLV